MEKNSDRQKGKFDARYLSSSEEEEDEISGEDDMKEELRRVEKVKDDSKNGKGLLKKRAEANKNEIAQNVK